MSGLPRLKDCADAGFVVDLTSRGPADAECAGGRATKSLQSKDALAVSPLGAGVLAPRRDVKSMRVAFLLSCMLAVQAAPASDRQSVAPAGSPPAVQSSPSQTPSVQTPASGAQASPAAQAPAVEDKSKKEKPALSVRASPPISF